MDESKTKRMEQQVLSSKQTDDSKLTMHVKVHSPFRAYLDETAYSISGVNATGPFDILPKHHNFMALLSPSDLVVRTQTRGEVKIHISQGVMHVKADSVTVFLDV